jgi:hypothetical protein
MVNGSIKSTYFLLISIAFHKRPDLLWEERAGGSNPSGPNIPDGTDVLMYRGQRKLDIARGMDRKMQLLGFWEFLKFFVRDLYASLAIVEFCNSKAFSDSVI